MVMMGYTVVEMADLLRDYSCMGLSPNESLALAEHIDLLVRADAVVPPMSPAYVAEWRTYSTLAEAAEAAGFTFDSGLTDEQREQIGGDYLIADGRWSVVNVGDGSSYLMRRVGDGQCGLLRVAGYEGGE